MNKELRSQIRMSAAQELFARWILDWAKDSPVNLREWAREFKMVIDLEVNEACPRHRRGLAADAPLDSPERVAYLLHRAGIKWKEIFPVFFGEITEEEKQRIRGRVSAKAAHIRKRKAINE